MSYTAINFQDKLHKINQHWSPKIIAAINDYHIKLSKLHGEFIWHHHEDSDEAFIVIEGELVIEFREGNVTLKAGEMFVVPKGVEHKPVAKEECCIMLIEPNHIVNTGNAGGERTVTNVEWI